MYEFEKTLLCAYNAIEDVVYDMDDVFLKAAAGSYGSDMPCEAIAEKLLAMTERKKQLLRLRLIVDEALTSLSSVNRRYIGYKYMGEKDDEIEAVKNTRNYFRRQVVAVVKFSESLKNLGFDEQKFKSEYLKYAFISALYDEQKEKEGMVRKLPSACYRVTAGSIDSGFVLS